LKKFYRNGLLLPKDLYKFLPLELCCWHLSERKLYFQINIVEEKVFLFFPWHALHKSLKVRRIEQSQKRMLHNVHSNWLSWNLATFNLILRKVGFLLGKHDSK
jgi:hypothetical protein